MTRRKSWTIRRPDGSFVRHVYGTESEAVDQCSIYGDGYWVAPLRPLGGS